MLGTKWTVREKAGKCPCSVLVDALNAIPHSFYGRQLVGFAVYCRDSFVHAYELMLRLHVFCHTGHPRRADCLASPSVCHMEMEASR